MGDTIYKVSLCLQKTEAAWKWRTHSITELGVGWGVYYVRAFICLCVPALFRNIFWYHQHPFIFFRRYLSNSWTFCNQTWYGDASSCIHCNVMWKNWVNFSIMLKSGLTIIIQSSELMPQKGGQGCLMSTSWLESQGCHLIPLSYLLSCFFFLVLLLFLSCNFSANGPFCWLFPENSQIFFVKGKALLYGSCWAVRRW